MKPLKNEMKSNFSLVSQLESDWLEITGGELAASHHACGTIVSGESLYFYQVYSYRLLLSFCGNISQRQEQNTMLQVFNRDVACHYVSLFLGLLR